MAVRLDWDGKPTQVERLSLPFQTVETINESRATRQRDRGSLFGANGASLEGRNLLIWGDNKLVMSSLLSDYAWEGREGGAPRAKSPMRAPLTIARGPPPPAPSPGTALGPARRAQTARAGSPDRLAAVRSGSLELSERRSPLAQRRRTGSTSQKAGGPRVHVTRTQGRLVREGGNLPYVP